MNKTKVDDLLIEMISPKIQKIEEKFSKGEGLNSEDVNTLLLKSQYNHINHLDDKLNDVASSVIALEGKFNQLEGKFNQLEGKFNQLEGKFELLKVDLYAKFDNLEQKIENTIQKALNKNMIQLVVILGAFATIFKIIDIFSV